MRKTIRLAVIFSIVFSLILGIVTVDRECSSAIGEDSIFEINIKKKDRSIILSF